MGPGVLLWLGVQKGAWEEPGLGEEQKGAPYQHQGKHWGMACGMRLKILALSGAESLLFNHFVLNIVRGLERSGSFVISSVHCGRACENSSSFHTLQSLLIRK